MPAAKFYFHVFKNFQDSLRETVSAHKFRGQNATLVNTNIPLEFAIS